MKGFSTSIFVGGILVAAIVAPAWLMRDASHAAARDAQRQAELARRELFGFTSGMAQLASRGETEALKSADLDKLVSGAAERFAGLGAGFASQVQQVRSADQRMGLTGEALRAVQATPAGLRSALGDFEKVVGENQKLLDAAGRDAQAAMAASRDALGVADALALTRYVGAGEARLEAGRLRAAHEQLQARARESARRWQTTRAERDRITLIDFDAAIAAAQQAVGEMEAQLAQSQQSAADLRQRLDAANSELEQVRRELADQRAKLDGVQQSGYVVGDDSQFDRFRQQMQQITARIVELEARETLLSGGGLVGATRAADAVGDAPITGGEPLEGAGLLGSRLAETELQIQKITGSRDALNQQVARLTEQSRVASERAAALDSALAAEREALGGMLTELNNGAAALRESEERALKLAADGVQAQTAAETALNAWVREARDVQQQLDPDRVNDRLKRIMGQAVDELAGVPLARARALVGALHTDRLRGLETYRDALRQVVADVPEQSVEMQPLEDALTATRDAAIAALRQSMEGIQGVAGRAAPYSWAYQAGLASAALSLSLVDESQAETHRATAVENIRKVFEKAPQHPRIAPFRALHDALLSTGAPAPATTEPPAEGDEAAPDDAGESPTP